MKAFYLLIILSLVTHLGLGQCVFNSNGGYTITAEFTPTRMVPQNGCTAGPGNFTAEVAYNIKVEGTVPLRPIFFYQILLTCGDVLLNSSGNLPITRDSISGTYTTAQNFFPAGDCASSTPVSLDCIGERNITFRGITGNFEFFNQQCEAFEAKPEVAFEKIDARFNNAQYLINWQVDKSDLVSYFVVERSTDQRNFEPVSDKIESQNESTFKFVDRGDELFENFNYYRIRLVANSGFTSYSNIFTGGQF